VIEGFGSQRGITGIPLDKPHGQFPDGGISFADVDQRL
jgi:hypothetical protein